MNQILIGVAVLIAIIIIFTFMTSRPSSGTVVTRDPTVPTPGSNGTVTPISTTPTGPYLWDPTVVSTRDPAAAVLTGTNAGTRYYVAAAKTSSGQMILGKSDGVHVWYYDGGEEKYVPIAQGYLLPASAVATATWGTTQGNGVALVNAPSNFVCRGTTDTGVHAGYMANGVCNITWNHVLVPKDVFEYLNI